MTDTNTVPVQYIGRRESFRDHLFGTGLTFTQGQTRALPGDVARKFLRHADQFAQAGAEDAQQAPAAQPVLTDDGTREALEKAALEQQEAAAKENQLQDMYVTIAHMPKDALIEFARNNYRQELDKSKKLGELRDQVRGFVDQFGMVG